MCFALFIPGKHLNDLSTLAAIGCEGLFDRANTPMFSDCFQGPEGKAGKLIYSQSNFAVTRYDPDLQEWLDCGEYSIGVWKEYRPSPEMLERERLIDGWRVTLCDGNSWVVPISDFCPKRLTIDRATGEEVEVVADEHKSYVAKCNELFLYLISDEFQERVAEEHVIRIDGGLTFAADSLAKNYRVNRDLVDLLKLVDEHTAFEVIKVATGLGLLESLNTVAPTH